MAVRRETILSRVAWAVSKAKSGISGKTTVSADRDTLRVCRSLRKNLLPQHLPDGISRLGQIDHKSSLRVLGGGV